MKKVSTLIFAAAMLLALSGCGTKNFLSEEVNYAVNASGEYVVPPLSDEIPQEAAYKATVHQYYNGKLSETAVLYYDEHDNALMLMRDKGTDYLEVRYNYEYKYDSNGKKDLYSTVTAEYDSEHHILYSEERYEEKARERMKCDAEKMRYEYDPVCGQPTLEEKNHVDSSGKVTYWSTTKYTYDEKGRKLSKESKSSLSEESVGLMEYTYEDIN